VWDTILIGIGALLNLVLAYLGLYVAVRPVEDERRKRQVLKWCFGASALALIFAVYVAARAGRAQEELRGSVGKVDVNVLKVLGVVSSLTTVQQAAPVSPAATSAPPAQAKRLPGEEFAVLPNGFLQFFKIQYVTGDGLFTVGKPLQLNVYYANKGQAPVEDALITASLLLLPRGNSSQATMDAAVIDYFEPQAKAETDKGANVGVDAALWTSPAFQAPLTQEIVDQIMQGQEVLYVISHARWKDTYEKSKEVTDCLWLEPPKNEHSDLNDLVWHTCKR
jgi:hypothetical protein